MPTLVIDMDGTICEQMFGDGYFVAKPIQPVIDKMRAYKLKGWDITIFTARGMGRYGGNIAVVEFEFRYKTEKWLKDHDVPYDKLIFGKPAGDLYVDDKGMNPHEFTATKD